MFFTIQEFSYFMIVLTLDCPWMVCLYDVIMKMKVIGLLSLFVGLLRCIVRMFIDNVIVIFGIFKVISCIIIAFVGNVIKELWKVGWLE